MYGVECMVVAHMHTYTYTYTYTITYASTNTYAPHFIKLLGTSELF